MSVFTKTAVDIFAAQDSSGAKRKVANHDVQVWGTEVERAIKSFQAGGGVVFDSKTEADGSLDYNTYTMAWVFDVDPDKAGIYQKQGASGSGSWQRVGDLPYSFILATNTNSGNPNAIEATTPVAIPAADGGALIALPIVADNTGSPVTVSFNGGPALTVKTIAGNDVPIAALADGMIIWGFKSGDEFRLVTDLSSAAILAGAQAAAEAAENAASRAQSYSAMLSADRVKFNTVAALLADDTMSYTPGTDLIEVGPGDIIEAQGFRYKVAASSVSDHHIETAGGVKLYVQPSITGRYNPLAFGAAMDGVTDDADILNKVIAIGPVILPAKTIYVEQPIILPPQANIKGLGQRRSYIKSGVVNGASTIKLAQAAISYIHLSGFTLQGNGLTGEDGNGHAIDFIDWDGLSGTHNPQVSLVERIEITGFKGFGPRDPDASATVPACSVIQWNGLGVTYQKVSAVNCSVGFWMERAQNSRIQDCIGDNCTYSAVLAISTENLVVSECDFVNCADGSTPSIWPVNVYNATVTSYANYGFVLEKTKLKNSRGGHLVASRESQGDVISKNWISVDDKWGTNHHGVFAHRSPGIRIIKNTFEPRMGASPNKARNIEIYTDQTWMGVDATVEGNTFLDPATGATTEFNIKLSGNSTSRTLSSVSIVGNTFGDAFAVSNPATIEADILIENCTLRNSIIAYNRHRAVAQVTRNVGVKKAEDATLINVAVGPNDFLVGPADGTIVAEYDGLTETILTGETVWDPDSIPSGSSRSTTVTVTGAMPGDLVEASSFSVNLQSLIPYAYVSSSNTVTFVLNNPSTNPIDLASGTVRVRVRRVT